MIDLRKKWTSNHIRILEEMVELQMQTIGYADFNEIAMKISRSAKSCNSKASGMGLLFHKYKTKPPETVVTPKHNMVILPTHKNNLFIDYWEGNPNTKRVNYPAVWEVLRRKKV